MSIAVEPTPRAAGHGVLIVQLDGQDVQRVSVSGEPLGIGRLPSNRLVLPDPSVSRHHAEVRVDGGRVTLVDNGSAGGTFLEGIRLRPSQPVLLQPGCAVKVGPYTIGFEAPVEIAPSAAPWPPPLRAPEPEAPATDLMPAIVPGRPTFPSPRPTAGPSRYLRHLPAPFQESDFLGRMLMIFEAVWEPLEQRQEQLPLYFDPATCPAAMLGFLARWLHLELDPRWPEARQRRLLAEAMELYRWRGTTYGLGRMIEVCTGLPVVVSDDATRPYVVRVQVTIPAGSGIRAEFVESLVRRHKPAHVGYVLEVK